MLTAPAELSEASQALWNGLVADLKEVHGGAAELDLLLLADALRARDRLEQVRERLDADGLTVAGSKGQGRPHPLLGTEATLRAEFAGALDRLKLSPRARHDVRIVRTGRLKDIYG